MTYLRMSKTGEPPRDYVKPEERTQDTRPRHERRPEPSMAIIGYSVFGLFGIGLGALACWLVMS